MRFSIHSGISYCPFHFWIINWYFPICFGTVRPCIIWYSKELRPIKPNVGFLYISNAYTPGCYVCRVVSAIYELPLVHIRTFMNDDQPVGNKGMKLSGLVCYISHDCHEISPETYSMNLNLEFRQ